MLNFYDSDKGVDHSVLRSIKTPFDGELSWSPTIVDGFANAVSSVIKQEYGDAELTYDLKKNKQFQWEFTITVHRKSFVKHLDLKVEFIKSPKCPRDLPQSVGKQFISFIKQFNNRQRGSI